MLSDPSRQVNILRALLLTAVAGAAAFDLWRARGDRHHARQLSLDVVALWAVLPVGFMVFLWFNHVQFPLQLETMEGTILQHVTRAAHGLPVYPQPTPGYVPLAYNPLFYYLSVPFTWLFGLNLEAIRLAAITGMAVSAILVYAAVRSWTGSRLWGWIALGLFACAYRTMDSALDNAHADSWLLCTALAGTYIIDRASTNRARLCGVVVLALSFWFKQHGALFLIGGVLYLTLRQGLRQSLPYWIAAFALGPLLYVAAGTALFGPAFHYFTWSVPRGWQQMNAETFVRVARFVTLRYGVLFLGALASLRSVLSITALRSGAGADPETNRLRVWHVQFLMGGLTALMGALDDGSSDNVFIPFGTFLIVLGTVGLAQMLGDASKRWPQPVQAVAVAFAFVPLIFAPQSVMVSPQAPAAYADFVGAIENLRPGSVYAPSLGPTAGNRPLFEPGANWVALEDMGRGPRHTDSDRARAAALLDSVMTPRGAAYVVTNVPLDAMPAPVRSLQQRYILIEDFGSRWASLSTLPKRWSSSFPRYLYRYSDPTPTAGVGSTTSSGDRPRAGERGGSSTAS
jgi:hypothetical protein